MAPGRGSSSAAHQKNNSQDENGAMVQYADLSRESEASVKPVSVNLKELDELIKTSKKPVVVDFWAPWCKPCQMMAPIFDQLSGEMADSLVFAKINVQDHQAAGQKYRVSGIPLFIVFKNGVEDKRIIGYKTKKDFKKYLNSYAVTGEDEISDEKKMSAV